MRELKFRAWNNEDKEYQRIDTIIFGGVNNPDKILGVRLYTKRSKYTGESYFYEIGSVVLEQYTDLKDKNGKEIYVGDIVECGPYSGKPIISEEGRYWLGEELEDLFYADLHYYIEVIGNIHENPELLGDTNVTNKEKE